LYTNHTKKQAAKTTACKGSVKNDIVSIAFIFSFYPHFTHSFPQVLNKQKICPFLLFVSYCCFLGLILKIASRIAIEKKKENFFE
jgi:hypothetical protein